MKICVHCIIKGRVQGVWYRDSARTKARELGISGWIKNVKHGDVETVACGEPEQVEKFKQWLKIGPMLAKVKSLECQEIPTESFDNFLVY